MKPWIDGEAIDKEVAEQTPCEECGGEMYFRSERSAARVDSDGFTVPASYRAFAVCANPKCGNEVEF